MSSDQKRKFGWLKVLGIVVVLLLGAIIAIPLLIDANQFRPKLESEFTGSLGREVKIGNLKLSLLSGSVAADDIAIADDPAFSRSPFVRAKSLQVGVELKPLIFSKAVHITAIALERPEINLIRSGSGSWNFSSIGTSSKPKAGERPAHGDSKPEVTIGRLTVSDGRITVLQAGGRSKPRVYDKVNVTARDLSFSSVFPFSLSASLPAGGSVRLEGKAGPVDEGDASLTPFSATIALTHLDVVASGFIEPDSGLAGIIDFNGGLSSDGRQMLSKGRARADKLQIVKGGSPAALPVALDYAISHHLKNQSGSLNDTRVEFGKSVAHLSGTYELRGDRTDVKMKLRGENMPAEDLQALLPAVAVTLPKGASLQGGTLNADLEAVGPIEKLVTTGAIGIVGTRLAGFDLGGKMATVASLAGIKSSSVTEIEKLASDLRVAPDGIKVGSLLLIVPALGQLTGSGTVGSDSSLDFRMLAKLNSSGGVVGGLTRIAGLNAGDSLSVPFSIRGTTSNPSFIPDAKGAAQGLLGSALSGKDSKTGQAGSGKTLGDTLRGLLGKKKN